VGRLLVVVTAAGGAPAGEGRLVGRAWLLQSHQCTHAHLAPGPQLAVPRGGAVGANAATTAKELNPRAAEPAGQSAGASRAARHEPAQTRDAMWPLAATSPNT
jgi:hypothetical protein